MIVVSDSHSFANILLELNLLLLPLFIENLLNIKAFRLTSPLLELHILAHLPCSTLIIFILRVLFFGFFKFLDEYFRVYLRKSRVREYGATLLLRCLEICLTQRVVEMAIAWNWGEDVGDFFRATTTPTSGDGGNWVAIWPDVLVFEMSVEGGIGQVSLLAE